MSLGWCGVDLFFVLSGYLITNILLAMRGKPHPYKTFYWRRVLRIFPIYYGYLLLVAALTRFEELGTLLRSALFLSSISPHTIWFATQRLLGHASFSIQTLPVRDHLFRWSSDGLAMIWSLSIEELFYLFWAPIILRGSRRFILWCVIIPVLLCPFLRVLAHTAQYPEYFQFLFRGDALMFGAIVALAFAAVRNGRFKQETLRHFIFAALTVPLFLLFPLTWLEGIYQNVEIRSTYSFTFFGYTLFGIIFAGIVAWCISNTGSASLVAKSLRNRILTYIGKISYCMYLIHIYAFVLVYRLGRHFYGDSWNPEVGTALLAAVLSIGLASFSWYCIESKIQRLKDRYFPSTFPVSAESAQNHVRHSVNSGT